MNVLKLVKYITNEKQFENKKVSRFCQNPPRKKHPCTKSRFTVILKFTLIYYCIQCI